MGIGFSTAILLTTVPSILAVIGFILILDQNQGGLWFILGGIFIYVMEVVFLYFKSGLRTKRA